MVSPNNAVTVKTRQRLDGRSLAIENAGLVIEVTRASLASNPDGGKSLAASENRCS
jgi:hypothetical protein